MVEHQLRARGIDDERVLAAMARVPRELFVSSELRAHAYADDALPIGHDQTISQPYMVARICAELALHGNEKVLDVGTGSGYQAAVLAELAGEVHSIERIPELADRAQRARSRRRATRDACTSTSATGRRACPRLRRLPQSPSPRPRRSCPRRSTSSSSPGAGSSSRSAAAGSKCSR